MFQPGDSTVYCNSNFIIAGILIEQLTGQPYGEVLLARITQPLGMANTSFSESQWIPAGKSYSSGYMFNSNFDYYDATEKYNMSVAYSAGAVANFVFFQTAALALAP